MITTDKYSCRLIADLLYEHGVKRAILCPGSRNAPLIVAISRHVGIKTDVVIDERVAAFIALGYASISDEPVAIVCTSGTAVLNFAPAVAEAYYRRVPLIVISADRPMEWIDQDDSQTIRQPGILSNIVKRSYDVPVDNETIAQRWYINRTVNDAMLMALDAPRGPVHINVELDAPLGRTLDYADLPKQRKISVLKPERVLPTVEARALACHIASPARVLVIVGFMPPDAKLSAALRKLSDKPNVAVMCEAQANLHGSQHWLGNIDSVLSILTPEQKCELAPDVVITMGGSLVSRFVKAWLRDIVQSGRKIEHWHVGEQDYSVDCFMGLTLRIDMPARIFMQQLASGIRPHCLPSDYAKQWHAQAVRAEELNKRYARAAVWSDYKAMYEIMRRIPKKWNLQLSNGTAVRYAQLFDYGHIHRIDCNRGVSGIDGCTSTAIGASMAYGDVTLLITGDMSAQYDMGALASQCITPRFKMIVLNNQGGGIFRFVATTANLPEREEYFCASPRLPLSDLARGFGFEYYCASSADELGALWTPYASKMDRPAMLEICTDPQVSADTLSSYFTRNFSANRHLL